MMRQTMEMEVVKSHAVALMIAMSLGVSSADVIGLKDGRAIVGEVIEQGLKESETGSITLMVEGVELSYLRTYTIRTSNGDVFVYMDPEVDYVTLGPWESPAVTTLESLSTATHTRSVVGLNWGYISVRQAVFNCVFRS